MIRCYCARGYCSSSSSDFKERDESFHLRGDSSSFFNHCNCCITHSQLTVFYQGRAHRHSSLSLAMFITFLCCLITLSQLSGQPSVLYFANRIFEQAGLGFEAALFIGTFMLHVVSESSFIIRTCFSQECSSWPWLSCRHFLWRIRTLVAERCYCMATQVRSPSLSTVGKVVVIGCLPCRSYREPPSVVLLLSERRPQRGGRGGRGVWVRAGELPAGGDHRKHAAVCGLLPDRIRSHFMVSSQTISQNSIHAIHSFIQLCTEACIHTYCRTCKT